MSIVKIIKPDERLVLEVGETKFYYKRIPTDHANAIRRKCTVRGELDGGKAGLEILKGFLLGWDNVQDWDGNEVPFNKDNITLIPDTVLADIITAISEADGVRAETVAEAVTQTAKDKTEKNS